MGLGSQLSLKIQHSPFIVYLFICEVCRDTSQVCPDFIAVNVFAHYFRERVQNSVLRVLSFKLKDKCCGQYSRIRAMMTCSFLWRAHLDTFTVQRWPLCSKWALICTHTHTHTHVEREVFRGTISNGPRGHIHYVAAWLCEPSFVTLHNRHTLKGAPATFCRHFFLSITPALSISVWLLVRRNLHL